MVERWNYDTFPRKYYPFLFIKIFWTILVPFVFSILYLHYHAIHGYTFISEWMRSMFNPFEIPNIYTFSKLLVGVFNKISLNTNSMFTKKITEDHTEIQFFSKKKLIKLFLCTCLAYLKFNFQQRMLLSKRGEKWAKN